MFDLEQAIAAWRQRLENRRVFLDEDLDELERHLRDHVAQLKREGRSEQEAFYEAQRELGTVWEAEEEYRKVYWSKLRRHRRALWREVSWRGSMLKNYLLVAWRNLRRQKGYAFINVAGLAVGLASCFLIALFVRDELSYDDFHTKADRLYRVVSTYQRGEQEVHQTLSTAAPLAPALVRDFPEVENALRISRRYPEVLVTHEGQSFYEGDFFFTDSSFFDVFDFTLIKGNPETALERPFTMVITEEMAQKYFGDEDPVGRTLRIKGLWDAHDYEITGVIQNAPRNSHFHFNFLASFKTRRSVEPEPESLDSWHHIGSLTYVSLRKGGNASELEQKLAAFSKKYRERSSSKVSHSYVLQPLTNIHLYSHYEDELEPNSDARYLYIFSALALLILIVAGINYMNLATARSARRAKEVGVRKVVGAHRMQLARQFLGESLLVTAAALTLAFALVGLFLPLFNNLTGKSLGVGYFSNPELLLLFVGGGLLVGLLAGSYPALYLSGFEPTRVLQGMFKAGPKSAWFRKGLVVFQFVVSIALIAGTIVIQRQLDYMQTKRLGLNEEHVVMLHVRDVFDHKKYDQGYVTFKNELLQHTGIIGVTTSNELLPAPEDIQDYLIPEGKSRDEWAEEEDIEINSLAVAPNFAEVMGVALLEGQNPSTASTPEKTMPVLINEAAARQLGWEEPIGKKFTCCFRPTPFVVGMVEDFHYQPLQSKIEPLVLLKAWFARYVMVRVQPGNLPSTLDYIRQQWANFSDAPMEYTFLDRHFDQAYRAEQRLAQVFGVFAGLAVLIACLGLFGLAAYTAERRTKEIGIRKVFGASVTDIVTLLSKDFAKLVLVAIVLAAPVAYYAMSRWLQDFAYRIDLSPWVFIGAGAAALVIALATVSYQAVKAALADPVDAIRYE